MCAGLIRPSGIWVCNDQAVDICVSPADVVVLTRFADTVCMPEQNPFSSQIFTDNEGGYNVVEGYANCDESPGTPPSAYGAPNDGVNGLPTATCGLDASSPCVQESTNFCVDGSVVVTSQDRTISGVYLLEEYIGSGDSESCAS